MGLHILFSSVISCFLVKSVLSADSGYENCRPKTCGKGPEISYPFYIRDNGTDYCGHLGFSVRCEEGWPVYKSWFADYIIEEINHGLQSFRLVDADVINSTCPAPSYNFSFARSSVYFAPNHAYIYFFYHCNDSFSANYTYSELKCNSSAMTKTFLALVPRDQDVNWSRSACEAVVAEPVQLDTWDVNQTIANLDYMKFLKSGFTLKWIGGGYDCANCKNSGGFCGFIDESNVCYCPDGPHSKHCHDGKACLDHVIACS